MDGIPPALPTDSEDVVWALQTADSLWKRGERKDAVVWVRRAAQAAGDADDAKRAASLARKAVELQDVIKGKKPAMKRPLGLRQQSLEELDRMFGDPAIEGNTKKPAAKKAPAPAPAPVPKSPESSGSIDVEVVSANDFEAGLREPSAPPRKEPASEHEVMTISSHAPDVELLEEEAAAEAADDVDREFPEEEPTPVRSPAQSPLPAKPATPVPSAAEAHAGMLDPWAEAERQSQLALMKGRKSAFDDEEVVTSAKRPAQLPPTSNESAAQVPPAPKAPRIPPPGARKPIARAEADEPDTTTYRQINPRKGRPEKPAALPRGEPDVEIPISSTSMEIISEAKPEPPRAPPKPPKPPPPAPPSKAPRAEPPRPAKPPSDRPGLDLLELVDSVVAVPEPEPIDEADETPTPIAPPVTAAPVTVPPITAPPITAPPITAPPITAPPITAPPVTASAPPVTSAPPTPPPATPPPPSAHPSAVPTPIPPNASQIPVSARPTAPPPSESVPFAASPSSPPTRPRAGSTLLDLAGVEALADLPDDAREQFAQAATMHSIAIEEEVSHFALALVVDGAIDVSSTIVDAPALKLEKNAILRSRGTLVPGVSMRLVCSTPKAIVATWNDAAVAAAFRTCPWVEEDLRAVTDKVQAKVGLTMGPLGERWDLSLREYLVSKLTIKSLAPGEVLVAQGKPVPLAIVGVGEVIVMKGSERTTLRPGDFVFPQQVLGHGNAPAIAVAGGAGAIVLHGDRAVTQELLMGFPPMLEVLATI